MRTRHIMTVEELVGPDGKSCFKATLEEIGEGSGEPIEVYENYIILAVFALSERCKTLFGAFAPNIFFPPGYERQERYSKFFEDYQPIVAAAISAICITLSFSDWSLLRFWGIYLGIISVIWAIRWCKV